jgi:hypothetical protein
VAISEQTIPVPDFWPGAGELLARSREDGLVLLPDDVRDLDGRLTASFRESAQNLSVRARSEGVAVEFVTPPGAERGMYRERAADWVLPWIVSIPTGVAIGLIVNEIQRVIDGARAAKQALPTIRYREVVIEDGRTTARELAGPADEIGEMLSRRLESGTPLRLDE